METDGYVTEIEYTSGYYRDLSPRLIEIGRAHV